MVKEKKEVMIMFQEENPKFQDITNIHNCFRFTEQYLRSGSRNEVPYIPFTVGSRGRIWKNTQKKNPNLFRMMTKMMPTIKC